MSAGLGWGTAVKLAVREVRSAQGRFLFVVLAVALGVGALTGVHSFSQAFRRVLLAQARGLMAGDLELRARAAELVAPTPAQMAALDALQRRHVRWTRITESVSMVAPPGADAAPILATLKAVDPAAYPFDGAVATDPPGALAHLDGHTVLASPDLLLRAGAQVGGTLLVGSQPFRILGVDETEPDRLAGGLGPGPRLLLTPEGLRRTGIIQFGSQISARLLFQLAPGAPPLAMVEAQLASVFPHAHLDDATHVNPTVERGLDHATTFLSLLSLVALIVGALGVAASMRAHLQLRLDAIATMKVLGARTAQIVRIYGAQTALLGLAGGLAGVALGALAERVFPRLLAPFFPQLPALGWSWAPAAEGLLAGVLITLLFTLPTLLSLRRVRPAWILRRHVAEAAGLPAAGRLEATAVGAALLLGLGALAAALTSEPWRPALRLGGEFLLGLAVAVGALALLAGALLRSVRWTVNLWERHGHPPTALRHGLANLYRPGSQARLVLVALGLGVMFTLGVFLLQRALLADLERGAPPGVANVFLIDIPASQAGAVVALLDRQPGRESPPELLRTVPARLLAPHAANLSVMSLAAPPDGITVVQGRWWTHPASPQMAVSEDLAARQQLRLGQSAAWEAGGRNFTATLAAIYRPEPQRLVGRIEAILSPGPLAGLPQNINGGVRMAPAAIPGLEQAMFARFPTVTVVNLADVIERVRQVVDQIALVLHFLTFFIVLAAAVVLAASVAGTRFRRMREIAVLKTCGATRGAIARIFSTEFLVLGLVAGCAGAGLALAFSSLAARHWLHLPLARSFAWNGAPCALAVAATAALAVAAGWLACLRLLGLKPLAVLRGE